MSKSPDWLTPPHIVEAVIATLGAIELDPCASLETPDNIPARTRYTIQQDGLTQPWYGRVYMNPPYGRPIGQWVARLMGEYRAGLVEEAIALLPARTDTRWFADLAEFPRCFIRGRLRFSGHYDNAPFPSMAVYLGEKVDAFTSAFSPLGGIYRAIGRRG